MRWNGEGAIRLLRHDRGRRVMLIERARPGSDNSAVKDDDATAAAVEVGLRIWRPAAEPFRWIGDHIPRWLDQAEQGRHELIPLPRQLYRMILETMERRLQAFAAAGLDEGRMRAWAVIRGAILGADEHEARLLRALL